MLTYAYNIEDTKCHKQQSYDDENGCPQEETTGNLLWGPVEQAEKSVVGNGNGVWLIVWINDLVPDVGYPETGNQQGQQDKQHGVSRPQRHMGAEK